MVRFETYDIVIALARRAARGEDLSKFTQQELRLRTLLEQDDEEG